MTQQELENEIQSMIAEVDSFSADISELLGTDLMAQEKRIQENYDSISAMCEENMRVTAYIIIDMLLLDGEDMMVSSEGRRVLLSDWVRENMTYMHWLFNKILTVGSKKDE